MKNISVIASTNDSYGMGHFTHTFLYEDIKENSNEVLKKINDNTNFIMRVTSRLMANDEEQADLKMKSIVESILNKYNDKISDLRKTQCIKLGKYLLILCEYICQLERLHPFPDANCRTICMLLLNLELLNLGLCPSIQSDPNYFDWMDPNQLCFEVLLGMHRTKKIIINQQENLTFHSFKHITIDKFLTTQIGLSNSIKSTCNIIPKKSENYNSLNKTIDEILKNNDEKGMTKYLLKEFSKYSQQPYYYRNAFEEDFDTFLDLSINSLFCLDSVEECTKSYWRLFEYYENKYLRP